MYRRRRSNRFSGVTFAMMLGMIAGVLFLMNNGWSPAGASATRLTPDDTLPPPQPQAPAISPTHDPFVQSRPVMQEITAGATLFAPTAGISTTVIQSYLDGVSWDVADLGTAAGHLQGTAWLDRPGNVVLAGHVELADGRRGVFANIDQLSIGDPLIITQNGTQHVYTVTELRKVEPDDLTVLYPSASAQLTLITCSDYDFLRDIYHERLVVVAQRSA